MMTGAGRRGSRWKRRPMSETGLREACRNDEWAAEKGTRGQQQELRKKRELASGFLNATEKLGKGRYQQRTPGSRRTSEQSFSAPSQSCEQGRNSR